jgi:hypothetical protein
MKYGCRRKRGVLLQWNYMILYAPNDLPPEGGKNMGLA